jgi:hypothetical protein
MYKNNDFIYEAVANLESLSGISIDIETSRAKYDAILKIKDTQFIVMAKSVMRASNQGFILSQLEDLRNISNRPIIFIADYISKEGASQLKERGFNYLDTAGNAFIREYDLIIYVGGQKRTLKQHTNQSRAFQEAGIKIIFHLLNNPQNLQNSYREIAQKINISIGSVSNVLAELEDLNFLIKTKDKRVLKHQKELLERWIVEFNTVLKPRIFRSKMKFIDTNAEKKWKNALIHQNSGDILWSGEPAGALLTENLKPQEFIIYSNLELPEIAKTLKFIPDKNGNVEIRQKFWPSHKSNQNIAPTLLVYSDLINSKYGRNVETANQIFDNELQHIQ